MQNQNIGAPLIVKHMDGDDMATYPKREYSKKKIKEAGRTLRGTLPYTEEVVEVFRIAHNWRMSHAKPMISEKSVLSRVAGKTADTAGRIKRMDSIRKKLFRSPISLDAMQDLGGVRAIAENMNEVRRIEQWYLDDIRKERITRHDDYIASPKASGYRSIHLIRKYDGASQEYFGQKTEIQIRTRLQHVWGTAGEAIGAILGEDLKASEGSKDWLRLLVLMSAHFCDIEGTPVGQGIPGRKLDRRNELRHIDDRIGASAMLSGLRTIEVGEHTNESAYLIQLDAKSKTVTIEPKHSYMEGSEGYFRQADNGEGMQSVLVSVQGIDALRRTYPNYFLDVGEFLSHLRDAMDRPTTKDFLRDYDIKRRR